MPRRQRNPGRARGGFVVLRDGDRAEMSARAFVRLYPELRVLTFLKSALADVSKAQRCPACGWTAAKIEETGLVGCPLCYEAVDSPLLDRFRGNFELVPPPECVKQVS
ncbi:MAG: hypothetical protein SNJ74_06760 [Fimbriimonadaceae bacterium]